ncbi:MAG: YihY family inner membrane protein [Polyangiaceae bacterium]|nr:YihY family inner membrane protein [Polyangiaceae bacterium]
MPLRRATQFFQQDLWSVELSELSRARAAVYRQVRLFWLALRGFSRDQALHRASGLAFDTVLGLLPLLALLVSTLKGFGAYRALVKGVLEPALVDVMGGMEQRKEQDVVTLKTAVVRGLEFVDRADFSAIGIVGLVLLVYVVILMLVSVEQSLNHVFGAERARSITRRIADYSAILFITPLCIMVAAAVTAAARSLAWFGGGGMLQLGAVMVVGAGLSMVYIVMPFTRVRVRSALYGGAVAGVAWYLMLLAHVHFQLGVARYNALYSTFAAFPLFLVWVFFSWIVVLFGAELTAVHQNTDSFRWRVRGADAAHSTRLFVAIRALAVITAAFVRGDRAPTLSQLRRELRMPGPLIAEVLDQLISRRFVVRSAEGVAGAYTPARDIGTVSLSDVMDALELETVYSLAPLDSELDVRTKELLAQMSQARSVSRANLTLRALASLPGPVQPEQGEGPDDPARVRERDWVDSIPAPDDGPRDEE